MRCTFTKYYSFHITTHQIFTASYEQFFDGGMLWLLNAEVMAKLIKYNCCSVANSIMVEHWYGYPEAIHYRNSSLEDSYITPEVVSHNKLYKNIVVQVI